jgi:hypothetical protein
MRTYVPAVLVVLFLAIACSDHVAWEEGRPSDAEFVAFTHAKNGLSGEEAELLAFASDTPFRDTLARYRTFTSSNGGLEEPWGIDASRFDLEEDCLVLQPWSREVFEDAFDPDLSRSNLSKLEDGAGSFVEVHLDDCDFGA